MRALAVLLTVAAATAAYADVSDSGNLTIGGNGVISGSMTVSGAGGLGVTYGLSASSVTASSATLTATGSGIYALTSSSGIHVLSGRITLESGSYIQWPDNTTSTTSAGGGGGNVVLSATQTFSGANTFTSGLTVALGATANFDVVAASADVVNVTSVTFGNNAWPGLFIASTTYQLDYWVQNGTNPVSLALLVNCDTAQHYAEGGFAFTYSGTGAIGGASIWGLSLYNDSAGLFSAASGFVGGRTVFGSEPGNTNNVRTITTANSDAASSNVSEGSVIMGRYTGSAAISSICIVGSSTIVSSQTNPSRAFNGHFEVRRGLTHK